MCKVMQDTRNEAIEKGRIQNAMEMLKDGLSIKKLLSIHGLPMSESKNLQC